MRFHPLPRIGACTALHSDRMSATWRGCGCQHAAAQTALEETCPTCRCSLAWPLASSPLPTPDSSCMRINKLPAGNDKMQEIAGAIQEGAMAYLGASTARSASSPPFWPSPSRSPASSVSPASASGPSIGFLLGGAASAAAGFIGMGISVQANVRTAEAARGGLAKALSVAFEAGTRHRPVRRRPRHPVGVDHGAAASSIGHRADRGARRPRLRWLAHLRLRPSRRRYLHQGR